MILCYPIKNFLALHKNYFYSFLIHYFTKFVTILYLFLIPRTVIDIDSSILNKILLKNYEILYEQYVVY